VGSATDHPEFEELHKADETCDHQLFANLGGGSPIGRRNQSSGCRVKPFSTIVA
jgi:hypothetical protein